MFFRRSKNAVQAQKKSGEVYSEVCPTERQFARIRSGNFNKQGAPHNGRTLTTDDVEMIETNRRMTTRGMEEESNILKSTFYSPLHQHGYVGKRLGSSQIKGNPPPMTGALGISV